MKNAADLAMWDLIEAGGAIAAGDMTARELTEAQLERIAKFDGHLHAYVRVMAEAALAQADAADKEIASGRRRGLLHGVPIAVEGEH